MRSLKLSAITPVLLLLIILAGCKKPTPFFDEINTGSDDANRKAVVKLVNAENDINVIALDVTPTLEDVALIEITRDPNSQADANQPLTVKLAKKSSLITDYNTANGTGFIELPLAAYTFSEDITNLTFAPGELKKTIVMHLKKDQMDLSEQYALGFTIVEVGTGAVIGVNKGNILYSIGLKNKYDGAYEVTGTMVDVAAALGGLFPMNYHLQTTGANTVAGFDPDYWVDYFIPILSGGSVSGYGSFSPVFTFDPTTDQITAVTNIYGQPAGNGRYAQLDPSGLNKWDPATGQIEVKFFMFQPSVVPLPNPRVSFNWHMKYLGPR